MNSSVVLMAVLLLFPVIAKAEEPFVTVGALADRCESAENKLEGYDAGYCVGIIKATVQTESTSIGGEQPKLRLCVPKNWSVSQGIKVFMKWAKNNPDKLHYPEFVGVHNSHAEAFPCDPKAKDE